MRTSGLQSISLAITPHGLYSYNFSACARRTIRTGYMYNICENANVIFGHSCVFHRRKLLDFEFEFKQVRKWNKYVTRKTRVECCVDSYIWIILLKKSNKNKKRSSL